MSAEVNQDAPFDFSPIIAKMPEPLRQVIDKKGWAKPGDDGKPADVMGRMLTSYGELEKLVGNTNVLQVPDLANDEAFGKWDGHKALGVPLGKDGAVSPEGYKLERPALPTGLEWGKDGIEWDDAGEKMLRGALAKGLIGQKQAERLFKEIAADRVGQLVAMRQAQQAETQAMENDLKASWGPAEPANKAIASSAVKFLAEKAGMKAEDMTEAVQKAMGNVATVKLFHLLGTMLAEDTLKGGKEGGFAAGPEAAKQQIKEMAADTDISNALLDSRHPGHKLAHEKRNNLFKIAYPDG